VGVSPRGELGLEKFYGRAALGGFLAHCVGDGSPGKGLGDGKRKRLLLLEVGRVKVSARELQFPKSGRLRTQPAIPQKAGKMGTVRRNFEEEGRFAGFYSSDASSIGAGGWRDRTASSFSGGL
jgi:hypothetical protein